MEMRKPKPGADSVKTGRKVGDHENPDPRRAKTRKPLKLGIAGSFNYPDPDISAWSDASSAGSSAWGRKNRRQVADPSGPTGCLPRAQGWVPGVAGF